MVRIEDSLVAVVFAAGHSSRMHPIQDKMTVDCGGKPVFRWITDELMNIELFSRVIIVGGANLPNLKRLAHSSDRIEFTQQRKYHGTVYAMLAADQALGNFNGSVLVVDGDLALLRGDTIESLARFHVAQGQASTILAFVPHNSMTAKGYTQVPYSALKKRGVCMAGAVCFRWSVLRALLKNFVTEEKLEYSITEIPIRLIENGPKNFKVAIKELEDGLEAFSVNTVSDLMRCSELVACYHDT